MEFHQRDPSSVVTRTLSGILNSSVPPLSSPSVSPQAVPQLRQHSDVRNGEPGDPTLRFSSRLLFVHNVVFGAGIPTRWPRTLPGIAGEIQVSRPTPSVPSDSSGRNTVWIFTSSVFITVGDVYAPWHPRHLRQSQTSRRGDWPLPRGLDGHPSSTCILERSQKIIQHQCAFRQL